MRLNRLIALASDLSRRAADAAIARGEVTVNGRIVTKLGEVVDAHNDRVELKGVLLKPPQDRIYVAFHKPAGCLVTKSDPHGRPTIWDIVPQFKQRLNAVGRLDFATEGLILLTDDGHFTQIVTHPRHSIWKRYEVRVSGFPTATTLKALADGVMLKEGRTSPARVSELSKERAATWLAIEIQEGWNRQVRRMCAEVGHTVLRLRRTAIGGIQLGKLKPRRFRMLGAEEIAGLLKESEA